MASWKTRMCTVASHSLSTWRQGLTAQPGDWTLTANGPENLYGTSGSTAVTDVTVPPPGAYTLGETGGPEGYRPTGWECEDAPVTNDQVTLAAGDAVTCTLTNKERSTPPPPTPTPTDDYGYGHGDDGYGNSGH
ncbi:hypothetical protein ACFWXZ_04835 [[Kitasatospora] papulosa]|uniref:hypothetical protein n=1 Tax=[Kitasatospora] papulosa TaxID=1464011 RepID=UPI0036BBB179